jgi:hypothetical protein
MLINIHSADRSAGTLEQPVMNFQPLQSHHTRGGGIISVKSVEIPFTWYKFRNGVNNTFRYIDSLGASKDIYLGHPTLQEGSPSASQLITTLTTQLNINTDGAVWTITSDPLRAQFSFRSTLAATWAFDRDPETFEALGFAFNSNKVFTANVPISTNFTFNLSPDPYIYVRTNMPINTGHDYDSYTKQVSDIIAKVPVNLNQFSNLVYEPQSPEERVCGLISSEVQFKITDRKGRVLNLNGNNWSMTLDFTKA